ncbi:MAG: DUF4347 domain-containing protein [Proteobacteria bacterium]|nr:DUF4347 domain-containing protein [Pseudomonadota bacterium]
MTAKTSLTDIEFVQNEWPGQGADESVAELSAPVMLNADLKESAKTVISAAAPSSLPSGQEIVFIDSAVADYSTLVADLRLGVEVVMLTQDSDGLAQIAAALQGRSNIVALHLVSHGSSGQLQLGSTNLTSENLAAHADSLAGIRAALNENADFLIYGCDVARGETGTQFIDALAAATGADVAASTDATGAASRGGNWVLETAVGPIQATPLDFGNYNALLATAYDTSYNPLNFGSGALLAGKDKTVGAQYVYRNVITVNGQVIDAVVTINLFSSVVRPEIPAN